eukprot:CAMPEP_0194775254 /NCGR_PEP_ID=MMETSP0323_2-20130528/59915_1 /TAXON_ID=2866 ORGANISM="Crypthecodinium cohnii, Strain Seligo" /NCGR_SAMPLE_ID=MMETSP0323_2 /ASSEMBLY_ACC=CAM_ASM_000346 /LENGTH=183 /DNA_ID=CAMNT_0039711163 /DNA_START=35 /DNA_END=583 /DNA_ORIENTATION=-
MRELQAATAYKTAPKMVLFWKNGRVFPQRRHPSLTLSGDVAGLVGKLSSDRQSRPSVHPTSENGHRHGSEAREDGSMLVSFGSTVGVGAVVDCGSCDDGHLILALGRVPHNVLDRRNREGSLNLGVEGLGKVVVQVQEDCRAVRVFIQDVHRGLQLEHTFHLRRDLPDVDLFPQTFGQFLKSL